MSASMTTAFNNHHHDGVLLNGDNQLNINDDAETFFRLQIISGIGKEFSNFNDIEKKQFILRFLNICKRHTINEFHLLLEPLDHTDLALNKEDIKRKTDYYLKEKQALIDYENSFKNLSRSNSRRTISSTSFKEASYVRQAQVPFAQHKQSALEKFFREKTESFISNSWNMNKEIFKANYGFRTDNVIERLKSIFREHYEIKFDDTRKKSRKQSSLLDTYNVNLDANLVIEHELSKADDTLKPLPVKFNNPNSAVQQPDDLKSIYLQKLNNHFYERKLWNGLNLTNDYNLVNLFPETTREYTDEFSIIKRYDWTKSAFGRNLSKYSLMPEIRRDNSGIFSAQSSRASRLSSLMTPSELSTSRLTFNIFSVLVENLLKAVKTWPNSPLITLLSELIKPKPTLTNIECLPDNILLQVFKLLDIKSLDRASRVCQRWNYLANTSELWIYKCKLIGQREGFTDLEKIVFEEHKQNEDIDWKLAYIELEDFIKRLKTEYADLYAEYTDLAQDKSMSPLKLYIKTPGNVTPLYSESNSKRESLMFSRIKSGNMSQQKVKNFVYVNYYEELLREERRSLREKRRAEARKQKSAAPSKQFSMSNHTNPPTDYTRSMIESNVFQKHHPNRDEHLKLRTYHAPPDNLDDFQEDKTDLKQTKDLLGKILPTFRLRWAAKNEDNDTLKPIEKVFNNLKNISNVQEFKNHSEVVTCVEFDKKRLITGSMDRTIFVYDINTGKFIRKLQDHKGGIRCMKLLKNLLCSGSWDCTVRIWNLIKFEVMQTICDNHGSVSCLDFNFSHLVAGSHDKTIRVWQFNENYMKNINVTTIDDDYVKFKSEPKVVNFLRQINHHTAEITSLKYDGRNCIISADVHGTILLTDLDGKLLQQLKHENFIEPITRIKLSGVLIMCSTKLGKIMFWNKSTYECEAVIQCHNDCINAIAFFDNYIYTASDDCTLKEWDLRTLTCVREIKTDGPVLDVCANATRFATSGKTVRLYDLKAK